MREGNINAITDCTFLLSKCIANMDPQERARFNDALEICPTWEVANKISYKHINDDLDTPIAIVRAEIGTSRDDGKNCCARANVMPITSHPSVRGARSCY